MSSKVKTDADPWTDINFDDPELQKLLDEPLQLDKSALRSDEHNAGFDNNVGDSWIYPSNMPLRCYQYNIAQAALYRNTLVVLPTGLGKTFIAAVVMYNFYRWYPTGKVIFMAPTRPLVAQQIEACQKIMPFPGSDTVELTGKLIKKTRAELWQSKRVFFATPQVVHSDIVSSIDPGGEVVFPFEQLKLLVVDEAHKAKGRYAYTEVSQLIWQRNRYFRMLALSATPGRTVEDVAEVVRNLFISHLEVRCDTSVDVCEYVHKRTMSTVVVPLSAEMESIRDELLAIIDPYLRQLIEADVLSGSLTNISRNWLLYEQKRFRDRSMHQRHPQQSAVSTNFSICISLYHALDLLERHGRRVFLNNFDEDEDGRSKFVVNMDRRLRELIERVRREVGPNPFDVSAHAMTNGEIAEIPADLDFGHPKFEKARACLLEHFQKNPDSRAIVFCEYRESVMLIYRLLLQHRPLLKPRCFVGQGGTTGFLRALTQKQQIQIMSDFRSGVSNILIATSIGEEGIDVGEVDLIVCFDINTSNPTRFVQRIGRTGRQKQGAVVMLVTAGKEQAQLKEVLSNKDQINKKIIRSSVVAAALYKHAPRMVPTEFNPGCLKTYIKPPEPEPAKLKKETKSGSNRSKKSASAAAIAGSQDLRKFFKKKVQLDAADLEVFADDDENKQCKKSTQTPGLSTQITIERSINKVSKHFEDLDLSNVALATTQTQEAVTSVASSGDCVIVDSNLSDDTPAAAAQTEVAKTSALPNGICMDPFLDSLDVEIDEERLRKVNKFLKSDFKESSEQPTPLTHEEFLQHLRSPTLLRVTKRIMLKLNVNFVREICEKMKILQVLEDEKENISTQEERAIRDNYKLIEDILEGGEGVEAFLERLELEDFKRKCNIPDELLLADDDTADFMKQLDEVFKDVEELGICNDNWDYIQAEYKKTHYYQEAMEEEAKNKGTHLPMQGESMVYETVTQSNEDFSTQMDEVFKHSDLSFTDSKYCDQWDRLGKRNLPYNSTPLQRRVDGKYNKNTTLQRIEESEINNSRPKCEMLDVECVSALDSKYGSQWDEFLKQDFQYNSTPLQASKAKDSAKEMQTTAKCLLNVLNTVDTFNKKSQIDSRDKETNSKSKESDEIRIQKNSKAEHVNLESKSEADVTPKNDSTPDNLQFSVLTTTNKANATKNHNADPAHNDAVLNSVNTTDDQKISIFNKSCQEAADSVETMLEGLDFDAFLEPFPEECMNAEEENLNASTSSSSLKENLSENSVRSIQETAAKPATITNAAIYATKTVSNNDNETKQSPDLFANDSSPKLVAKRSLADKLAVRKSNSAIEKVATIKTPTKSLRQFDPHNETSPSIFDVYVKNKRRLARKGLEKLPIASEPLPQACKRNNDDESLIIRRRNIASKRKILDSESEEVDEEEEVKENVKELEKSPNDSSSEEIQATQQHRIPHQLSKRRRLHCSFVEQEAAVSGSDCSADEFEHTQGGHYVYDSIVVPNDEAEEDEASRSRMQAMYLQSLKSPVQRRGAFKIPAFRVFNDRAKIFSQAVPVENSQYVSDSFVVNEDEMDAEDDVAEASLCPLERAERILKEQRRARRQYAQIAGITTKKKKKAKIYQIEDSSEED